MSRSKHDLSFVLILLIILLVACNSSVSPTSEMLTKEPVPTEVGSATSLTLSSDPGSAGHLPEGLDASVLNGPLNIIGSMAMLGGGVYSYPYNDGILICIQSDVQSKSGLLLMEPDGTWIRDLNPSATYQNLIVADHFLFALDYLDNNRLLVVDMSDPNAEYPIDICTPLYGIANGYIYYLNTDEGNQLYRCFPDGSEEEKLTDHEVLYFYLLSDRIIYIENIPGSNRSIHRMSLDGEVQSSEDNACDYYFAIANDTIFSSVVHGPKSYICSFNLDVVLNRNVDIGGAILTDSPVKIHSLNATEEYFLIEGMKDGTDAVSLWIMNHLGADIMQLSDAEGVYGVQMIGDHVYFRANSYRSQHCVVKTDGSGFKVLFN